MKKVKGGIIAAIVLVSLLAVINPVSAATINVPGNYGTIQAAVDAANSGDTITVAAGTYDEGGLKISNKSLTIIGTGNVTITGTKGSFDSDLKFHGSRAPGTSVFGSMDYVVGVYNGADVDFVNVTIDGADNLLQAAADQYFAGVAFYNAQGSFSGCEIKRTASNPATSDGASVSIYIDTDSGSWELEVSDCTFNTWPRNAISAYGSGTTLSNVLTVDVDESTFTGREGTGPSNSLQNGITVQAGVDLEVDNCTFSALSRPTGTGGSADVCISGGYAYKSDSAYYAPAHDLTINNCTFYINGDKYIRKSVGMFITTTGTAVVENCTFTNLKSICVDGSNDCDGDPCTTPPGPKPLNPSSQDVTIRNCTFNGPSYPGSVDYYMCGVNIQRGAQVDIENCTFDGFHDDDNSDGDGVCFCSAHFDPTYCTGSTGGSVTCSTFSDCVLAVYSGTDVTPLTIINNIITGNDFGIYQKSGSSTIHNTITGNGKSGIYQESGTSTVKNNIITENGEYGIYCGGGTLTNAYNDVWNNASGNYFNAVAGLGSISVNPQLDGTFHLTSSSPCIDAGTDAGVYTDIEGDSRPLGGGFDMGADEYVPQVPFVNPIPAFRIIANYHLRQANTCLGCIGENLPEDVPEDVQTLLDEMQEHINNANTTGNTIYANNELLKALKCCEDIQEKLGITCPL